MSVFKQIQLALSHLNPNEVRELADRRVRVRLMAATPEMYGRMHNWLVSGLSPERRAYSEKYIQHGSGDGAAVDVEIWDDELRYPEFAFPFDATAPQVTVRRVLEKKPGIAVPLARFFPPFRECVSQDIVKKIAKENAAFSLATALPDVLPSILTLPWAVGQFASDTAFLTMNQIRMAFLLAAANDRIVGYSEQRSEIASIIASAFGWRALARELVGKIPLGGGLVAKAAVAYAGTFVVGKSLDRFFKLGYGLSKDERKSAYDEALKQGRSIGRTLMEGFRARRAQKAS
jgi:uncharacterized protein (DUF697 family)